MRRFAAFLLLLALVLTSCGTAGTTARNIPSTSATTKPSTDSTATTAPTTITTVSPTTTTTRPAPSAYDQLAPFVSAAQTMDGQLRTAADLINSAGPPWTQPDSGGQIRTAIEPLTTTGLSAVAKTIPAGLPNDLLRPTLLVYSDLASRSYAMRLFGFPGPSSPSDTQLQTQLLQSLAHGAPAAARFASDLNALVSAARAAPPITVAASTSRQAAYVLLLVADTNLANGGCGGTGGAIATRLPSIDWTPDPAIDADGTLNWPDGGKMYFIAHLVNGSWQVVPIAC